jgi:hypothetical protein
LWRYCTIAYTAFQITDWLQWHIGGALNGWGPEENFGTVHAGDNYHGVNSSHVLLLTVACAWSTAVMGTQEVSEMVGNETPRVAAAVEVSSSAMVMVDFCRLCACFYVLCIVGPKKTSA